MIPFGVGCRIITLGTHNKMKWFLEDINMENDYVDLTEDVGGISKEIINIFQENNAENCAKADARIKAEKDRLWEISEKNKEVIMSKMF